MCAYILFHAGAAQVARFRAGKHPAGETFPLLPCLLASLPPSYSPITGPQEAVLAESLPRASCQTSSQELGGHRISQMAHVSGRRKVS